METILQNLEKAGEDMSKDLVLSQRAFLIAVKTYFEIKQEKTVKSHSKFLIEEGMFEPCDNGFMITAKAKRMFGYISATNGITIKPEQVNEIEENR